MRPEFEVLDREANMVAELYLISVSLFHTVQVAMQQVLDCDFRHRGEPIDSLER